MNKQKLYNLIKIIPHPIRKVGKLFYNPIIPVISKVDYGEDTYPEGTDLMCEKLKQVIKRRVKGEVIEFGTYRGATTLRLAKLLKNLNSDKIIYTLDTFEGLPKETKNKDKVPDFYKGSMDKNDIDKVREVLKRNGVYGYVYLLKGLFSENIPKLKDKTFCFAYVDCDLYEGTKQALEYLIPRMSKGGIIFIDDYYSKNWIGVKKAVLELIDEKELHKDLRIWWRKHEHK